MNITKNGLYDTYPIYFVQELKRVGRRDMAIAFLDYWDDYRSDNLQANAYYAKCWHNSYKSRGKETIGLSRTTAGNWIEQFNEVIANFQASWELFEGSVKAIADSNVEKSIGQQSDDNETKEEATKPKEATNKRPKVYNKKQTIGLKDKTNNNTKKYLFEDEDLALSELLYSYIKKELPKFKEPNWDKWSHICNKMRVDDDRSIVEISNMIKFIFTNDNNYDVWDGSFYKSIVLDMNSLRNNYNKMSIQIKTAFERLQNG